MPSQNASIRRKQALAWTIAGLFVLGFFYQPVGMWSGPILGVWFVGTQKPVRGLLLQLAFVFFPSLLTDWRHLPLSGLANLLHSCGWLVLAALLSVLPFTFHRLVAHRLPGVLATLALPSAAAVFHSVGRHLLPAVLTSGGPAERIASRFLAAQISSAFVPEASTFLVCWFAVAVILLWNGDLRSPKLSVLSSLLAVAAVLAAGFALESGVVLQAIDPFAIVCLALALLLAGWAILLPTHGVKPWSSHILSLLRSPFTGTPLNLVREDSREFLTSAAGERFPIRQGIPAMLRPQDFAGLNGKYNRLYEIIGGMYDDAQRVLCALNGIDRDAYVMSYLGPLEAKPGDRILETSVGTGLNLQYLPRAARFCGLDLSPAMLAQCQLNLRRWGLNADLFLGNAESLPFADSSFDVVFHVGGINFFNDRAKAIREMIRVAKPGSRILIADETEEHVKSNYEKCPLTGQFYKNRAVAVIAPVDLVPPEMEEVHLEQIKPVGKNRFYVLTFRKPAAKPAAGPTAQICNLVPSTMEA